MKRSLIIGIVSGVVIVAATVGYLAGLRTGVALAQGSHAAETGVVAVEELTLLEAGLTDKAMLLLEAGVDDGLIGWSDLTSTRARLSEYIFGSGLPPFDDERLIRRIAKYRKAHPSPWAVPAGVDGTKSVDPDSEGLLNWRPLKERDAKIAAVVQRYAR
jgi:hypothetical protein